MRKSGILSGVFALTALFCLGGTASAPQPVATNAVVTALYPDKTYWWTVTPRGIDDKTRSFPAHFRTLPRKDGRNHDGVLRPSLLPDDCYKDDIPTVDMATPADAWRVVPLAEGTEKTYYGHPYTTMLPDGKTIWAAFREAEDHVTTNRAICLARSTDGGKSWKRMDERIPADYVKCRRGRRRVHDGGEEGTSVHQRWSDWCGR